mmetsp:Transcript_27889/g.87515  ORF Transcript_27889/g.87515 Transcript_27889/m.87515 type:complete len:81 (-) Transcript_27889:256-498(-)
MRVKEADAACGVGARVWDAGVGLSIWLQRHSESCARAGKAVLELGSGVGVGGISAALAGARPRLPRSPETVAKSPEITRD